MPPPEITDGLRELLAAVPVVPPVLRGTVMPEKRTRPPTMDELRAEIEQERRLAAKAAAKFLMAHVDDITAPYIPDRKPAKPFRASRRKGGP